MTTLELLQPHLRDDTPLGDLARDAIVDPDLPPDPDCFLLHMRSKSACQQALSTAAHWLRSLGFEDGGFCHD